MENAATISANTLFHFTSDITNLLGILAHNFYPRYCLEDHSAFWPNKFPSACAYGHVAIPMVCFCDIPLSSIRSHVGVYGKYALRLTKAWGERRRISPVMYAQNDSISATVIRESISSGYTCSEVYNKHIDEVHSSCPSGELDNKDKMIDYLSKELMKMENRLIHMMAFTKNYVGNFVRAGREYKNVRFYDEREWRHVPEPGLLFENGVPSYLSKEDYLDVATRDSANGKLEKPEYMLEFEPADIRYIIVERQDQILSIMDEILKIKGSKYSYDDLRLLTARIIPMEQILEDF